MTTATTAALQVTPRTVHVEAMPDHLQSLARGKPVNALAELIWNALDADATEVHIGVDDNDLGSPVEIRVADNGDGIASVDAERAFGNLGGSWKKERARSARSDKRLHGRDGKGRFKAFAIGDRAVWNTTFKGDSDFLQYQISGQRQDLSNFSIGTPVAAHSDFRDRSC